MAMKDDKHKPKLFPWGDRMI